MERSRIYQLYLSLLKRHGPPEKFWPQWCKRKKTLRDREIIALGAILTQRTSWHNAELALLNLKKAGLLSIKKIAGLNSPEKLVPLIRAAGFYQSKPKRLFGFCSFVAKIGGLEKLKKEQLLKLSGIGPETADTILLYAANQPTFVIDEYTKRLVKREKLARKFDYQFLQKLFEKALPEQASVYQDFHALIILEQRGKERSLMERL